MHYKIFPYIIYSIIHFIITIWSYSINMYQNYYTRMEAFSCFHSSSHIELRFHHRSHHQFLFSMPFHNLITRLYFESTYPFILILHYSYSYSQFNQSSHIHMLVFYFIENQIITFGNCFLHLVWTFIIKCDQRFFLASKI